MIQPLDDTQVDLKVVRGNPNAEELAVIAAVLQASLQNAQNSSNPQAEDSHSSWSRNSAQLRSTLVPGNGQWQAAYRRGLSK